MKRTTRAQLIAVLWRINRALEAEYELDWSYGRPRLSRNEMSVWVSPRLAMGDMLRWLEAFEVGIAETFRAFENATTPRT